jgi:hypothetical protein
MKRKVEVCPTAAALVYGSGEVFTVVAIQREIN